MDKAKQKDVMMDYFTRLKISTSCIVCGSEDWFIGRTGPAFEVKGERKVLPVEFICNFCGRIASYDAEVIGHGKISKDKEAGKEK